MEHPSTMLCYDSADLAMEAPIDGPAGSVLVTGTAARPGVYEYLFRNSDGTSRKVRQLVTRKVLWDAESIMGLARAPVTLDHPPVLVDSDNVMEYAHGDVDNTIIRGPGDYVQVKFAVRTTVAKDGLASGERTQLSPGYIVALDWTGGTDPEFGDYDAEQIKRTYNHLALVGKARGGPDMRVQIDGADVPVARSTTVNLWKYAADALNHVAQIDAMRTAINAIVVGDSMAQTLAVNAAKDGYYYSIWPTYDALCDALHKALEMEDEAAAQAEIDKIAAELKIHLDAISTKFAEDVKKPAVEAPPAESESAPQMDADGLLAALNARFDALQVALDALKEPVVNVDAADVEARIASDRMAWYTDRRALERAAESVGVKYSADDSNEKIASEVCIAADINIDGLNETEIKAQAKTVKTSDTNADGLKNLPKIPVTSSAPPAYGPSAIAR